MPAELTELEAALAAIEGLPAELQGVLRSTLLRVAGDGALLSELSAKRPLHEQVLDLVRVLLYMREAADRAAPPLLAVALSLPVVQHWLGGGRLEPFHE